MNECRTSSFIAEQQFQLQWVTNSKSRGAWMKQLSVWEEKTQRVHESTCKALNSLQDIVLLCEHEIRSYQRSFHTTTLANPFLKEKQSLVGDPIYWIPSLDRALRCHSRRNDSTPTPIPLPTPPSSPPSSPLPTPPSPSPSPPSLTPPLASIHTAEDTPDTVYCFKNIDTLFIQMHQVKASFDPLPGELEMGTQMDHRFLELFLKAADLLKSAIAPAFMGEDGWFEPFTKVLLIAGLILPLNASTHAAAGRVLSVASHIKANELDKEFIKSSTSFVIEQAKKVHAVANCVMCALDDISKIVNKIEKTLPADDMKYFYLVANYVSDVATSCSDSSMQTSFAASIATLVLEKAEHKALTEEFIQFLSLKMAENKQSKTCVTLELSRPGQPAAVSIEQPAHVSLEQPPTETVPTVTAASDI